MINIYMAHGNATGPTPTGYPCTEANLADSEALINTGPSIDLGEEQDSPPEAVSRINKLRWGYLGYSGLLLTPTSDPTLTVWQWIC